MFTVRDITLRLSPTCSVRFEYDDHAVQLSEAEDGTVYEQKIPDNGEPSHRLQVGKEEAISLQLFYCNFNDISYVKTEPIAS